MTNFNSTRHPLRLNRLGQAIRHILDMPRSTRRFTGGALTVGLAGVALAAFGPIFELSALDGSNGFTINGIAAYDGSGTSVSAVGDVNGDGIDDLLFGAGANQSYVVFGRTTGFPSALELSSLDGSNGFVLNGIAVGDNSGASVSGADDINGDGIDDLLIGAPFADPNSQYSAGQSFVVFGRTTGFPAAIELSSLDGANGFALNGIAASDFSGVSVSAAGDVNGDGIDDFLIGAAGASPGGNSGAGQSYVVFGRTAGFPAALELSSLDGSNGFTINGIAGNDHSGSSVSNAGDVNGDGIDDLLIGAPGADSYDGQSYVVFGRSTGFPATLDLDSLDGSNGFALNGSTASTPSDLLGSSVSAAGDVNGDGIDDFLIGAPFADYYNGETYVVFGRSTGFPAALELSTLDGGNGFVLTNSTTAYNNAGSSVSVAGDVNGDGVDDLLIGAPFADPDGKESAGQSFVVFGRSTGFPAALDLDSLDGSNGFALNGIASLDRSGSSVSNAGDVNDDGIDDVLIGAPVASPNGKQFAGQSYVVFGSRTAEQPLRVSIDILPGRAPNCVRIDGRGIIPLAILGSPQVRAVNINPASLTFAGLDVLFRKGKPACQLKPVNGDPFPDLVCQFVDNKAQFTSEHGTATLTGQLRDTTAIQGTDKICLLKPKPR